MSLIFSQRLLSLSYCQNDPVSHIALNNVRLWKISSQLRKHDSIRIENINRSVTYIAQETAENPNIAADTNFASQSITLSSQTARVFWTAVDSVEHIKLKISLEMDFVSLSLTLLRLKTKRERERERDRQTDR